MRNIKGRESATYTDTTRKLVPVEIFSIIPPTHLTKTYWCLGTILCGTTPREIWHVFSPRAMDKKTCPCQNSGLLASLYSMPPSPATVDRWYIGICHIQFLSIFPLNKHWCQPGIHNLNFLKMHFIHIFKIHCYKKWWQMFVFNCVIGQLKYFITVQTGSMSPACMKVLETSDISIQTPDRTRRTILYSLLPFLSFFYL